MSCFVKNQRVWLSRYGYITKRSYSAFITTGGIQGVEGRLPFQNIEPHNTTTSTGITITDPFIIYQNYIQSGLLEKDPEQVRIMKEFQKLYHRVLDYTPPQDLLIKLSLLLRKIELQTAEREARERGISKYSPLKLNAIRDLFVDPDHERKQLIRHLTDEEELYNFNSPQGLLVNGEVGCGKSMLMDIFAASLPHESKMRWHYNNFILWVFNEMYQIQNERLFTATMGNGKLLKSRTMENEFILYELAQKMINRNTILMLDEFVLPDIAQANIIKILFTYYFKLGGVLVATSNKLPEELYANQFHKLKFRDFVGILNSRCHSVDMKSAKDYRTYFAQESVKEPYLVVKQDNPETHDRQWIQLIKTKALNTPESPAQSIEQLGGKPSSITVYNRTTNIPLAFNNNTICYLDFKQICQGHHSSSDYITIASIYKTIVLDNVPVMTTKMKNEARRFITLLDAIYESKCQFFMRCEVEIDYLFFPDALHSENEKIMSYLKSCQDDFGIDEIRLQVQDEEMFAKTSIALMNPYRPNISTYDQDKTKTYDDYSENKNENEEAKTPKLDYKNMKAFTGDDEKFAFKRAVLRIKEMVGSDLWRNSERWVPIDQTMRPWENSTPHHISEYSSSSVAIEAEETDAKIDKLLEEHSIQDLTDKILVDKLPKEYSEGQDIPFRQFNTRIAPVFKSLQHFWAMGSWTSENGKRLKDSISKKWIRSSIRN